MIRRRGPASVAVLFAGVGLALVLHAPDARAYEDGPVKEEEGAPASDEPATRSVRGMRTVVRVGGAGDYRRLYDLSILGGGLALSIGGEADWGGAHANLHVLDGRTAAGLGVLEVSLAGTVEWRAPGGLRCGVGLGAAYLGIQRATNDHTIASVGPLALGRIGWDFGDHAYVLVDIEGQVQASGAGSFGPTLQLGAKF